jgi:hypothetical protein
MQDISAVVPENIPYFTPEERNNLLQLCCSADDYSKVVESLISTRLKENGTSLLRLRTAKKWNEFAALDLLLFLNNICRYWYRVGRGESAYFRHTFIGSRRLKILLEVLDGCAIFYEGKKSEKRIAGTIARYPGFGVFKDNKFKSFFSYIVSKIK